MTIIPVSKKIEHTFSGIFSHIERMQEIPNIQIFHTVKSRIYETDLHIYNRDWNIKERIRLDMINI